MGRSRTRTGTCFCALAGLSLILPFAPFAMAQAPATPQEQGSVFEYIPADAWAAVIIRDLKGVDEKVIGIGQELGLPVGPGSMVGDPLMMLKGMLGIGEGLQDKGSVALVLLKTEELNAEALSKNVVLLVPCTEPKTFLEQFATPGAPAGEAAQGQSEEKPAAKENEKEKEKEKEGAETQPAALPKGVVKISLMGKPNYGAVKGKFAVLAPEAAAITSYLAAKGSMKSSLSPDRLALVEKKIDLFVWVNVAGAGPAVKDTIKSSLMGIMLMASMSDPTIANQVQPLIQNVEKFLEETASLQLGLAVARTGFDLDLYMQAKPDTEMAKSIAERQASETSLLINLPAEKFILAVGAASNTKPEDIKQGMTAINGFLDRPAVKNACDPEKLAEFRKILDQLMELGVGKGHTSLTVSRLPEGENGMIGMTFVGRVPKDAKKWLEDVRKLIPLGLGMVTDEDARKFLDAITYKPDAEKIGDIQVDQIAVDLTKISALDESDIAAIKRIAGKEGPVVRIAALDDAHVAMLFGGGPKRVEEVAAIVKKGEAPLASEPSLKTVAPYLPKGKRFFEMYVAVDTLLRTINDVAAAAGEKSKPIPVEIPEMEAPLAVVGTVGKDSQQINIYVPMKLVKNVKDIATAAMAEKMMPSEPAESQEKQESAPEKKASPPDDTGLK
jgi:hypothetical protein